MNPRRVNISFMHNAALAGMEAGICNSLGIKEIEYHDNLIFTSMIQAGVKHFHVVGNSSEFQRNSFLKDRIEYSSFEKYHQLHEKVKKIIKNNTSDKEDDISLSWFLTDILYCLSTKTSMVTALPIPKPDQYAGKISLELYALINGLLRSIESIDLSVPVPRMHIKKTEIDIFKDIYFSGLFDSYSNSHGLLEIVYESTTSASKEIAIKGKKLYNKYSASLDIKQVSVKILPAISTFADIITGGLATKLADPFISIIEESISKERKITLYDYRKFHMQILRDHYAAKTGINFSFSDKN